MRNVAARLKVIGEVLRAGRPFRPGGATFAASAERTA